ncbi:MAG: hybrid sensor histidine kinase/response regulator [Proteiniphilum sp.]|nr:hybrid sensor histidine kinase/response regulator [Proteiniphilum sp.]
MAIVIMLGLTALYLIFMVSCFRRMRSEDMSELRIVRNTISTLIGTGSRRILLSEKDATQDFLKYESITPKIRENLNVLKLTTADSLRTARLDTIQLMVDRKRENLHEIAVLLDSISRAPEIVAWLDGSSTYQLLYSNISKRSLKELHDYIYRLALSPNPERGLVIRGKLLIVDSDLDRLIEDTTVNKAGYSGRLDPVERQKPFLQVHLARYKALKETNQVFTLHTLDLLKEIEHEEEIRIIEEERKLDELLNVMFTVLYAALLILLILFLVHRYRSKRIQRSIRQLEASNRRTSDLLALREKLIYTISHDIRASVSSILGFIEMLDVNGDAEIEEDINDIKITCEYILELVSALLDYRKLERGNWHPKESNFDLHSLVGSTASGFEPPAARKGLEYVLANDLPERLTVYGDPYMLRRIMSNIISNAVKYTCEGSVRVRARLDAGDRPGRLIFSVTDTGVGIDDADRQFIFQEFRQLDTPAEEEGCGLGLAITSGFVEVLGGIIHLNSRKGEGSEFIVEIPLKEPVERVMDATDGGAAQRNLEGISVLLVDDDAVQLKMTSEMLARMSVRSVTEENPDRVPVHLRSERFDMLLIDIRMPGTNGMTLVEKIRRPGNGWAEKIPVIGLSAGSDIPEEELKAAGFTDFLTKPFTSGRLREVIGKYVRGVSLAEETFATNDNRTSEGKGVRALIEVMDGDRQLSVILLKSYIDGTGKSRDQLEKAFRRKDRRTARRVAHRILPLYRLMGDRSLTDLMERLEKSKTLSAGEKLLMLDRLDDYLEEAEILKKEICEN